MDPYEVIKAKRDGETLDRATIREFVSGFTNDNIPEYQMSAWLMAVWFNGMTSRERADLTDEMVQTGLTLDYPNISEMLVDKHSTGGVGDGVSLSLVPLVASLGVKIPMMSGRGLGHTGGTLDKLESIPGIELHHSQEEINQALEDVGAIIMGQTDDVAPADGEMYALRDVTATIDSVDLIASSIMSKKIAEGMDALVLDVKTGSGAFMEDYEDSVKLARAMVEIGRELDKKMEALITNMEQPLGRAVGNAIEMRQHIEILKGNGPKDLRELVARLAGSMLMLDGKEPNREAGYDLAKDRLKSGDAIDKLRQIIEWQNGDPSVIDDSSLFPQASETTVVKAEESGILQSIDAFEVGMAARSLGAGRENLDDDLDYAAGVLVERKVGEPVDEGDALFELKYNDDSELNQAKSRLQSAVAITDRPVEPDPLVQAVIDHEGEKLSREIRFPK